MGKVTRIMLAIFPSSLSKTRFSPQEKLQELMDEADVWAVAEVMEGFF